MLRPGAMGRLYRYINATKYLKTSDFEVENKHGESEDITEISFIYRHNEGYYFNCRITTGYHDNMEFEAAEAPGRMKREEQFQPVESEDFYNRFEEWVRRMEQEILALPLHRAVIEQEAQLKNFQEQLDTLSEEPFSLQEIQELRSKLETLAEQLTTNIAATEENKSISEEKIARLERDIQFLKEQLEAGSHKGWWSAFIVRLNEWRKEPANQALLEMAKETTLTIGPGMLDKLK